MKKCTIFFFSGTGNTYHIARSLADELNARGLDASISAIDAMNLSEIEWEAKASDILGMGFPIYGSLLPAPCAQFLKILPELKNEKSCFAFTTQPFVLVDGVKGMAEAVYDRGYRVRQRAHFSVPHNAPFVYKAISKEEQRKVIDDLERPIKELAKAVAEDEEYLGRIPFDNHPFYLGRLNRHYNKFKMKLSATSDCTKCGACAAQCPMRNITVDDEGVKFADKCCGCMRCINFCPVCAIQYKGKPPKSPQYRGPGEDFSVSRIYKKG